MKDEQGNTETPEQRTHRLELEARTRQIAEVIKGLMPPETAFVLVTAERGQGGPMSYCATLPRDQSARMLTELLDGWKYRDGLNCEPTVQTATFLRERVKEMEAIHPRMLLKHMREAMESAESMALGTAQGDEGSAKEMVVQVMSVVTMGLALLQSFNHYAHAKAQQGPAGGTPA
jgi:hypothetical protein